MHERLAVYVPDVDAPATIAVQVAAIKAGSGIVGRRVVEDDPESPVLIYFEGNLYGYVNIVTYADRVSLAADRLTDSAPTVAMRLVRPEAVIQVAWFYPTARRVEVIGDLQLSRVAKWLNLWDDAHPSFIHGPALAGELKESA